MNTDKRRDFLRSWFMLMRGKKKQANIRVNLRSSADQLRRARCAARDAAYAGYGAVSALRAQQSNLLALARDLLRLPRRWRSSQ
jgi:hypothetical protein